MHSDLLAVKWGSLREDNNTDTNDAAQLLIFVWGVKDELG
jgi:hypothetical protein